MDLNRLLVAALASLPLAGAVPARGEVVQDGPDNLAIQCGPGGGSPEIGQRGRRNVAVQVQEEAANSAVIRQEGEENTAIQRQSGRRNVAVIRQSGAGDSKMKESGDAVRSVTIIEEKDGRKIAVFKTK